MNLLGDFIKNKRIQLGLSLREFAALSDLSHTHIDSIEKGIDFRTGKPVRITNDTIAKLAKALNEDPSYIFELSINAAMDKFIYIYPREQSERMKREAGKILNNDYATFDEKFKAQEDIIKAHFSDNISYDYDLDHYEFEIYAAKYLGQPYTKEIMQPDIYNALVKKYGALPGMKDGSKYLEKRSIHNNGLTENELLTLAAHKIGHTGELSESDLDKIKLAVKIALAKDDN